MKAIVITILFILFSVKHLNVQEIKKYENVIFSENNLYAYIIAMEIKYPEIVFAQAKLESSHFKSKIFRENHNLFGMKLPRKRKTTATGENRGHSVYSNWMSSVQDYKLWQDRIIHKLNTKNKYYAYLGKNYAADENYVKLLKRMN
jgi:uncharacterized FlgJ-related protein